MSSPDVSPRFSNVPMPGMVPPEVRPDITFRSQEAPAPRASGLGARVKDFGKELYGKGKSALTDGARVAADGPWTTAGALVGDLLGEFAQARVDPAAVQDLFKRIDEGLKELSKHGVFPALALKQLVERAVQRESSTTRQLVTIKNALLMVKDTDLKAKCGPVLAAVNAELEARLERAAPELQKWVANVMEYMRAGSGVGRLETHYGMLKTQMQQALAQHGQKIDGWRALIVDQLGQFPRGEVKAFLHQLTRAELKAIADLPHDGVSRLARDCMAEQRVAQLRVEIEASSDKDRPQLREKLVGELAGLLRPGGISDEEAQALISGLPSQDVASLATTKNNPAISEAARRCARNRLNLFVQRLSDSGGAWREDPTAIRELLMRDLTLLHKAGVVDDGDVRGIFTVIPAWELPAFAKLQSPIAPLAFECATQRFPGLGSQFDDAYDRVKEIDASKDPRGFTDEVIKAAGVIRSYEALRGMGVVDERQALVLTGANRLLLKDSIEDAIKLKQLPLEQLADSRLEAFHSAIERLGVGQRWRAVVEAAIQLREARQADYQGAVHDALRALGSTADASLTNMMKALRTARKEQAALLNEHQRLEGPITEPAKLLQFYRRLVGDAIRALPDQERAAIARTINGNDLLVLSATMREIADTELTQQPALVREIREYVALLEVMRGELALATDTGAAENKSRFSDAKNRVLGAMREVGIQVDKDRHVHALHGRLPAKVMELLESNLVEALSRTPVEKTLNRRPAGVTENFYQFMLTRNIWLQRADGSRERLVDLSEAKADGQSDDEAKYYGIRKLLTFLQNNGALMLKMSDIARSETLLDPIRLGSLNTASTPIRNPYNGLPAELEGVDHLDLVFSEESDGRYGLKLDYRVDATYMHEIGSNDNWTMLSADSFMSFSLKVVFDGNGAWDIAGASFDHSAQRADWPKPYPQTFTLDDAIWGPRQRPMPSWYALLKTDFDNFCEKEHNNNNINFLKAVAQFRSDPSANTAAAKAIIDLYVRDDAAQHINVASGPAEAALAAFESEASMAALTREQIEKLLEPLYDETHAMVSKDFFERFKKAVRNGDDLLPTKK